MSNRKFHLVHHFNSHISIRCAFVTNYYWFSEFCFRRSLSLFLDWTILFQQACSSDIQNLSKLNKVTANAETAMLSAIVGRRNTKLNTLLAVREKLPQLCLNVTSRLLFGALVWKICFLDMHLNALKCFNWICMKCF